MGSYRVFPQKTKVSWLKLPSRESFSVLKHDVEFWIPKTWISVKEFGTPSQMNYWETWKRLISKLNYTDILSFFCAESSFLWRFSSSFLQHERGKYRMIGFRQLTTANNNRIPVSFCKAQVWGGSMCMVYLDPIHFTSQKQPFMWVNICIYIYIPIPWGSYKSGIIIIIIIYLHPSPLMKNLDLIDGRKEFHLILCWICRARCMKFIGRLSGCSQEWFVSGKKRTHISLDDTMIIPIDF